MALAASAAEPARPAGPSVFAGPVRSAGQPAGAMLAPVSVGVVPGPVSEALPAPQ